MLSQCISVCSNKWSEKEQLTLCTFFLMHTNVYTHNTWQTHYYRLSTTHTHAHSQREKLVHTERHKQRQTCRLIQLRVSSIIQHSAHRHRLKDGIKHAQGPHLEITRTLPVFKMQCWEVKIDLGWLSQLRFFKYTNKKCPAFCFFLLTNHGPSLIPQISTKTKW